MGERLGRGRRKIQKAGAGSKRLPQPAVTGTSAGDGDGELQRAAFGSSMFSLCSRPARTAGHSSARMEKNTVSRK